MSTWQCVTNCGACCNLEPSDRPDLDKYLSAADLEIYMSLVGDDGWCVNYEQATRRCSIYENRPSFCRVTPKNFEQMYGVENQEFNEFAIACCCEQITGVYGFQSQEIERYLKIVSI